MMKDKSHQYGTYMFTVDWVGKCDWRYETTFDWRDEGASQIDLVFDGLDTFAQVVLNGAIIGETANMNRTYRFDVAGLLRVGDTVVPPTGKAFKVRMAATFEFKPGSDKIVCERPYFDQGMVLRAIGLA